MKITVERQSRREEMRLPGRLVQLLFDGRMPFVLYNDRVSGTDSLIDWLARTWVFFFKKKNTSI